MQKKSHRDLAVVCCYSHLGVRSEDSKYLRMSATLAAPKEPTWGSLKVFAYAKAEKSTAKNEAHERTVEDAVFSILLLIVISIADGAPLFVNLQWLLGPVLFRIEVVTKIKYRIVKMVTIYGGWASTFLQLEYLIRVGLSYDQTPGTAILWNFWWVNCDWDSPNVLIILKMAECRNHRIPLWSAYVTDVT